MAKKNKKKVERLSPKDIETIMKMTSAGKTMREIAKKIGCAPSTVWRHQQLM